MVLEPNMTAEHLWPRKAGTGEKLEHLPLLTGFERPMPMCQQACLNTAAQHVPAHVILLCVPLLQVTALVRQAALVALVIAQSI